MHSISSTSFRKNLSSILDKVENDRIPYYITRKNHKKMVIITEEDYNSTQETLYLLSNQANADRIRESIKQVEKGEFVNIDFK